MLFNIDNTNVKVWQPKGNGNYKAEFHHRLEDLKAKSEAKTFKECLDLGFKRLEYLYNLKKLYQEN
jgi:hypothetical protein